MSKFRTLAIAMATGAVLAVTAVGAPASAAVVTYKYCNYGYDAVQRATIASGGSVVFSQIVSGVRYTSGAYGTTKASSTISWGVGSQSFTGATWSGTFTNNYSACV